jgi:hypothetical protein
MQSTGLWSLNHDLTTSLGLTYVPNLPKIYPHLHRCNSVRVHSCAHPHYIKVLIHFVETWFGCGMESTGLWSLNHDLTTVRMRAAAIQVFHLWFLNSCN